MFLLELSPCAIATATAITCSWAMIAGWQYLINSNIEWASQQESHKPHTRDSKGRRPFAGSGAEPQRSLPQRPFLPLNYMLSPTAIAFALSKTAKI
jgi:hypothetical protein